MLSRLLKLSLPALLIITMVACGGGGGGGGDESTPTDPDQIFSLNKKLLTTTTGTIYTSQLTGSDSEGTSYTGTVYIANRTQEMLNGVLVTPHDLILSITSDDFTFTITGTSYSDTDGNLIEITYQTTGVTCTPVMPDKLPDSVKVGDFGILSALICSDNTTLERNWRVEDASNGNIRLITNGAFKNQNNTIVAFSDVTYTIDSNGNIIGFNTVTTVTDYNYTQTFESI